MLRDWKPNDAVKAEVERAFNWSAEFSRQVPGELDWDRVTWVEDTMARAMRFRYTQPASTTFVEEDPPSLFMRHIVHVPAWAFEIPISYEQLYRLQPARTYMDDVIELFQATALAEHERNKQVERDARYLAKWDMLEQEDWRKEHLTGIS